MVRKGKLSQNTDQVKPLVFMDDFCKQRQVFLTNDDRLSYTVNKSKSHFGLFKKTVNNAFKHVKEAPEVFGMDTFLKPIKEENPEEIKLKHQTSIKSQISSKSRFGRQV